MSDGDFSLHFEHRKSYLYVYIEGHDSFAASLSYWNQIADKAKKLELHRLLVHENLTGSLSEAEIFDITQDVIPAAAGIKVAFYDENQADQEINNLGELIANNRGAFVRVFQTLEDAEKWITSED